MRNLSPTQEYNSDDPSFLDPVVSKALREFLPKHFESAINGARGEGHGGEARVNVEAEWVGVMGFTPDRCPLVGPLDALCRPNEYVLAGYTGHGMPVAFLAGKNIAAMIAGGEEIDLLPPKLRDVFHPNRFLEASEHHLACKE